MPFVWKHLSVALGLSVGFMALLLGTSEEIGYARDEGFYFQAAASYEAWFSLLFSEPSLPELKPTLLTFFNHLNSLHSLLVQ